MKFEYTVTHHHKCTWPQNPSSPSCSCGRLTQAEISFKAGIKEVVDWVDKNLADYTSPEFEILSWTEDWRNKLKEWGIDG